jgi:hypothetical protein
MDWLLVARDQRLGPGGAAAITEHWATKDVRIPIRWKDKF